MRTDQCNIVEGHGKMMTKGNEVGKEYYFRRIAFNMKGNSKGEAYQEEKGYHTVYQ